LLFCVNADIITSY